MAAEELEDGELLGRGSFGIVRLLKNHKPPAVVKYLNPDLYNEEAFQKECAALKKLAHSNIVRFYGIRERETEMGTQFGIIMEYCSRESIKNVIFDPKIVYHIYTVISWAKQLYGALHFLYILGYIHRDISPNNVFITEDFTPKIGDFGCTKQSKMTCIGTRVGTLRYTSPPSLSDPDKTSTSIVSHKNDVYSLGLVLWEAIERKIVLSNYGQENHFYDQVFLMDYFQKRITSMPSPDCPNGFKKIIDSCILFEYSNRPNAHEVFVELCELMQKFEENFSLKQDTSINSLKMLYQPRIEDSQKELLKPIGFDETERRVLVQKEAIDLSFLDISLDLGFQGVSESSEERSDHSIHESLSSAFGDGTVYGRKARSLFAEKFQLLTEVEKIDFLNRAPQIVSENLRKVHNYDQFRVDKCKLIKDSANMNDFLENIFKSDLYYQMNVFDLIFHVLEMVTKSRFAFWDAYDVVIGCESQLRDFICGNSYIQRICAKTFFSTETKEDWLLLEVDEARKCSRFVKKDFSHMKVFYGTWVDSNLFQVSSIAASKSNANTPLSLQDFEVIQKDCEIDLKDLEAENEMIFSHLESLDIYIITTILEKLRSLVERSIRMQAKNYIEMERAMMISRLDFRIQERQLPIACPGYVFQLRNPPRLDCKCSVKCDLIRGYGKVGVFPFDVPQGLLALCCYKCTNDRNVTYQRAWVFFLERFNKFFVERKMNSPSMSGFTREGMITKLTRFQLRRGQTIDDTSFIFLQYPGKDRDSEKKLILLDYPDNYKPKERIPCFDYDWHFYSIEASILQNYFEKLDRKLWSYLVLNHDMEGWELEETIELNSRLIKDLGL